uniref:Uncharacterized protein n=1 Tax=Manihot esculenta TaxID=3983 RepID=A0A2C9VVR7_MANES
MLCPSQLLIFNLFHSLCHLQCYIIVFIVGDQSLSQVGPNSFRLLVFSRCTHERDLK